MALIRRVKRRRQSTRLGAPGKTGFRRSGGCWWLYLSQLVLTGRSPLEWGCPGAG